MTMNGHSRLGNIHRTQLRHPPMVPPPPPPPPVPSPRFDFHPRNTIMNLPQPGDWVHEVQRKFEALGQASFEVSKSLETFQQALYKIDGNLFNLVNPDIFGNIATFASELSNTFQPHQTSTQAQLENENVLSNQEDQKMQDVEAEGGKMECNNFLNSSVSGSDLSPEHSQLSSPNPNSPKRPTRTIQGMNGKFWTEEDRTVLNDEFVKYYQLRCVGERVPYKIISDELLIMCGETPPQMTHLTKRIGDYLRRTSVPVNPIILQAIENWILSEKTARSETTGDKNTVNSNE
ncbi:hypothetical protein G9A89_014243 [Geosiphon pyriformis]|nr:hypothetical protein G9A89_014243 [Geosiphon pyriformis]